MNAKQTAAAMAGSWVVGLVLGLCLLSCGAKQHIQINPATVMPMITQCVEESMNTGDRDALVLSISLCSLRVAEAILADKKIETAAPVRRADGGR